MQLQAIMSMKTKDYLEIGQINKKKNPSYKKKKISIENYQEALKYMNKKT